jgi:hypothetical protein
VRPEGLEKLKELNNLIGIGWNPPPPEFIIAPQPSKGKASEAIPVTGRGVP